MLLKQGVKAALPNNTQKQAQGTTNLRRQRKMAQIKEQTKSPKKELNKMEITNLSDAELKTLVMRMLRELTEYIYKIKKEMKDTLSEIKKNIQGTNSGVNKDEDQINDLEHKEKKIQSEQQEKKKRTKQQE